ncbi:MAG: response regulator [Actinobacteria bacterium]|nr:response regulator [Actinomycetota bacterium]
MSPVAVHEAPQVLVVDDDAVAAEHLAVVLRDRFGADVVVRPDAYQALDVLLSEHIDVALVDLFMPGATGLQLVERLRNQGSNIPVVLMTELVTPDFVARVEAFPATTLVTKSPDAATSIAWVERFLPGSGPASWLVVDNLVVNHGHQPRLTWTLCDSASALVMGTRTSRMPQCRSFWKGAFVPVRGQGLFLQGSFDPERGGGLGIRFGR